MSKNKATIWGNASNCPYCDKAEALLNSKGWEVEYYKIGKNVTKDMFLERFPGIRTVPQIELNGIHIGGYSDLCVYFGTSYANL